VVGIIVFGLFGLLLVQSSLRAPLVATLKNADVLVTGVFGVGGWLFVQFLNNVNERFNSVDERFNSVEAALRELKTLLLNQPPSPKKGG
jgi:amino acid permease